MAGAFNPAIASDYKVAQKKRGFGAKKKKRATSKSTSLNTKQRQRKIKQKAQTQKNLIKTTPKGTWIFTK